MLYQTGGNSSLAYRVTRIATLVMLLRKIARGANVGYQRSCCIVRLLVALMLNWLSRPSYFVKLIVVLMLKWFSKVMLLRKITRGANVNLVVKGQVTS